VLGNIKFMWNCLLNP